MDGTKWPITALTQPHPRGFWEDTRRRLLSSLHGRFKTRQPGRAVASRPEKSCSLIEARPIDDWYQTRERSCWTCSVDGTDSARFSFFLALLEHMTHEQQVKAVSDADVSTLEGSCVCG